jgi:hypothetical protein
MDLVLYYLDRTGQIDVQVVMSQWAGSNIGNFNIVQTSSKQTVRLDGVFNIISYELVSKLQEILVNSDFKASALSHLLYCLLSARGFLFHL